MTKTQRDIEELRERIADLESVLAHARPFRRGTTWMTDRERELCNLKRQLEWFEQLTEA